MNNTPRSERLHIGIFGRCNSGKSSLINALTGQYTAVVSDVAGTTTDPVSKSIEITGIGACVVTDTAGFDDAGTLGAERLEMTRRAADRSDVAVMIWSDGNSGEETYFIKMFRDKGIPVIPVLNKSDILEDADRIAADIERMSGLRPVIVSAKTGYGISELIKAISAVAENVKNPESILGSLVGEGDVVMLVMPQDAQAPKGRLILPQAQVIRELLDRRCVTVNCVPEKIDEALQALNRPPKLVITDSQVFGAVSKATPQESMLTSFSVLFARYKGDIGKFVEGAAAIDRLTENSKVLIAEACTHTPQEEDIGRVKIPAMLRARVGQGLTIDVVGGADFPADLTPYDLVIHCGACMFNRHYVMSRVSRTAEQGVPITNYGIAIAYLTDILNKVVYPKD